MSDEFERGWRSFSGHHITLILWLISEAQLNTKPLEKYRAFSSGPLGIGIDSEQLCCSSGAAYYSIEAGTRPYYPIRSGNLVQPLLNYEGG
jgi:hypothetical protein